MTSRTYAAAAAVLALVAASPARAQDTAAAPASPASLAAGKHAFSFAIPQSGDGTVGGWVNLSGRTQLGLELGGSFRTQQTTVDSATFDQRTRTVQLGLEVRRFTPVSAAVAPFVGANAFAGYGRLSGDEPTREVVQRYWNAGVGVGVGVEWFPVPSVSVGGRLGLSASYSHSRTHSEGAPGPEGSGDFFDIGTGTSSLTLKIYF